MRFPYLTSWDNTPVVVDIGEGGIDENGAPEAALTFEGKCTFTNEVRTSRGADGIMVTLGGVLTIRGDIAPSIPHITGAATVEGAKRKILRAQKVRNPDGTVNHTRLELL